MTDDTVSPRRSPVTAKPLASDAPPGTPVFVVEDMGTGVTLTETRSKPWDVCGSMSVMLVGRTGGYLLERCFDATAAITADRATAASERGK